MFTRELVGMQVECVAAYVRLTRLPHRDHSPHQPAAPLTSFIGVHFLGKRRQKCPLPFKSAPAIIPLVLWINLLKEPHTILSSPVTPYFAYFEGTASCFEKLHHNNSKCIILMCLENFEGVFGRQKTRKYLIMMFNHSLSIVKTDLLSQNAFKDILLVRLWFSTWFDS